MPGIRAVSKLDELGDSVRRVIKAYHGGPHDFDGFDASKIGTGEGAQAYGHGLYFSEAEPVAEWYRKELSGPPDLIIGGEPVRWIAPTKTPRERALRLLQKSATIHHDNPMQAVREAMLDAGDQYGGRDVQPIISSLMRFKSDGVRFGPRPGKTYEVEIAHPESSLLDWDKPVHEQPDQIYDALGWSANPPLVDTLGRSGWTGSRAYYKMANEFGGADKVAQRLRDSGVPGIRYLDQGSRGAGEGTRNYVMFPGTEDSIRILRKYGMMAPIAAGAMQDEQSP